MTYTHGHHSAVLRSHGWRTAANSAAYLLDHLRAGMSVLDVGCGPGTITADLARLVAPGRVVGLEPVPEVVARAGAELSRHGLDNAEAVLGDVYALDFPDHTFDVVHAHQVLQHLADPVAALREMRRVCRPGGVVAARDADYSVMTWYPRVPELDEWLALYRETAHRNGGEPDAGPRLKSWALAAGFAEVACSASTYCFASDEDRAWWGDSWADRVSGSALATQAIGYGLATQPDLDRIAAGWRSWVAAPDGWFGVLHGEILATA